MYIFCSKALADALNIKKITVYLGANEGNPLYNFFTSVIQNQNFSPSSYTSSVSLHTSV